MKKSKSKALAKKAKKSVLHDIQIKLVGDLTEVTAKLGKGSKKLRKTIEKGSAKLAKKISKELKIKKPYSASMPAKAPIVKPEAPAPKDVQATINSTAADKPPVRRARVNTTLPAQQSSANKSVPAVRKNNSKKATGPILK